MIHFYECPMNESVELIEKGIRRHSIEKFYNLDIIKSTVLIESDERFFLGLENANSLKLLRIRSVLEFFLPKLIIKFDKNNFSKYSLRFSIMSFIIAILIIIGLLKGILGMFKDISNLEPVMISLTLGLFFLFLTKWEVKLINRKIIKAIKRVEENIC